MNLRVVLTVEDFDEAVSFYRDALGLEQQAESVDRIEADRRVSGTVRLALEVGDDLDGTAQRLLAAGAKAEAEPVVPPWGGRNARLRAPDGMQLTLFSE